jgi:hypothetical protein
METELQVKNRISWVEKKFYLLSRGFIFLLAFLALSVSIGAVAFSGMKYTASADTTMHEPKISYADFQSVIAEQQEREAASDTTLEKQTRTVEAEQKKLEFERLLKPKLDSINKNISLYSEALGMPKPAPAAIGAYLRESMEEVVGLTSGEMAWAYVDSLVKATDDLAADRVRLSKLSELDPARLRWDKFLEAFTSVYLSELKKEQHRIASSHQDALIEKASATLYLGVAAGAFLVFVATTMLLILFRIERNTRN